MRRVLLALAAVLLLVAVAAFAFWPGDMTTVEPAASSLAGPMDPQARPPAGSSCTSCALRHKRLSEPKD